MFAGTINHEQYLKDETGNRRYWPIAANGEANLEWLREWRDQLWAEASQIEKTLPMTDEALELPRELWPVAAIEQEKRMTEDSWLVTLRDFLMPDEGQGARYHSADIFRHVLMSEPGEGVRAGPAVETQHGRISASGTRQSFASTRSSGTATIGRRTKTTARRPSRARARN